MTGRGTVTRVLQDGLVEITMKRRSACASDCRDCAGCGGRWITAVALNKAGASEGDSVTVESRSGSVIGLAALTYLMPAVMLVAGFVLGGAPAEAFDMPGLQVLAGLLAAGMGILLMLPVNKLLKRRMLLTVVAISGAHHL